MTRTKASYLADPSIVHLPRLLQEIRDGLLVFPRFQRPAVWRQEQRIELFKSVLRGVPIGTIMVWRTNKVVPHIDSIRSLALPVPAEDASRQYVLDGLQRLSTLYRELMGPETEAPEGEAAGEDDGDDYAGVLVDLRESLDDPRLFDTKAPFIEDDEDAQAWSLRLGDALNSRALVRRLRELDALGAGQEVVEHAELVASRLREYKIPVVPYVSDSVPEVTRAFQLVNSQGTPMSDVHMVNALAWTGEFRFLDEIQRCQDELERVRWKSVDETVLLRCFAVAVGLDGYEYDVETFAKRLKNEQANGGDRVIECLGRVAQVLRGTCGILVPELVPYSSQILVLFSALLDERDLDREQEQLVANWLWYTTYLEAFSGSTSASMISRVTEDLTKAVRREARFRWKHRGKKDRREFPRVFDFRHARSRALALLLAREQDRLREDPAPFELLAAHRAAAVVNVVPVRSRGGAWSKRLGCRFLVSPDEMTQLVGLMKGGPANLAALEGHFVNEVELAHFAAGQFREFAELRSRALVEKERDHFEQVNRALRQV